MPSSGPYLQSATERLDGLRLSSVLSGTEFFYYLGLCHFFGVIRELVKSGFSIHVYLQVEMEIILIFKLTYQHLMSIVSFESVKQVTAAFAAEPSLCPVR